MPREQLPDGYSLFFEVIPMREDLTIALWSVQKSMSEAL